MHSTNVTHCCIVAMHTAWVLFIFLKDVRGACMIIGTVRVV